ncbi:MAG: hypothetical protein MRY81_03290 [Donghicola eburneus]|uniref:hypothetical protein n=1 Tax=Primorskyibacter sp. 2E233 TaxID=3413431 RepID=UPI0026F332CC|nr:hypothetical protein [Donghicola eburneus]MCI5038686.1 hypothetical protein [Donghicola eburneus]
MKTAITAALMMCMAVTAWADDDNDDAGFGAAGILSRQNAGEIPGMILSAGMPLLEAGSEITLQSGKHYELEITADGSQELALHGAGFFRAIWIDEIVIEGIELRPLGVDSLEFDEAGSAEISFLAVKPGTYTLGVPGNELQTVKIKIE